MGEIDWKSRAERAEAELASLRKRLAAANQERDFRHEDCVRLERECTELREQLEKAKKGPAWRKDWDAFKKERPI